MRFQREWILPVVAGMVCPVPGYAVQYLKLEEAQKLIFPTADRLEAVANISQKIWRAFHGKTALGFFILDEVLGKHENITYAVGLGPQGEVLQVEIMDYRESYGGQIRQESWRRQFKGKTEKDPLQLDKDILNISGATLSCRHVTEGVKRLLNLYQTALKP